jgi:hypothetical protein
MAKTLTMPSLAGGAMRNIGRESKRPVLDAFRMFAKVDECYQRNGIIHQQPV